MSGLKENRNKNQHKWSNKEKEYIKNIAYGRGYKEITQMMNEKFEYQFREEQIKGALRRYGLNTGRTGQFVKGLTPWNKGTKGLCIGGKETQFKKGHIPINHKEIGSERVNVNGYAEIKIAEPTSWKSKHRVIYEKYHNTKLTSNDIIIFLDGNKANLDIKNLQKITRSELARINNLNLIKKDAELTKIGINIASVICKYGQLNRNQKKNKKKK